MAIIAISGKIGSGKDTVGKIIQGLTSQQSSLTPKDILDFYEKTGQFLNENLTKSNWIVKKFAGNLKKFVSILTGISVQDLEKEEVKDSYLGKEWERFYYFNNLCGRISKYYTSQEQAEEDYTNLKHQGIYLDGTLLCNTLKIRELLQTLGTEALRDVIHPNVHINGLFVDYKTNFEARNVEEWGKDLVQNWIITDLRFPNELKAVKDIGGITIRIGRFNEDGSEYGWGNNNSNHSSETALDNSEFDYTINNSGTIEDLIEKVKEVLVKEQII